MGTAIERRKVEMSHGATFYFEAGSGPAVLLLHGAGFTAGGHAWLPLLPQLAEHFHVYAPDCLGFGPGDVLEQPDSFAYLVDHLREFQDALRVPSSHVVGHSMGGWLGVLLAYESPDRVGRFVNVAGGGAATRPLATMVGWEPPDEATIQQSLASIASAEFDTAALVEEWVALARDRPHTDSFRRLMDHMTNPETRQRYNTRRRLPHVAAPTLVLWGADDQVNDLELGRVTHELLPDSELVVLEGVGHGVPQQAPGPFLDAVVRFLTM